MEIGNDGFIITRMKLDRICCIDTRVDRVIFCYLYASDISIELQYVSTIFQMSESVRKSINYHTYYMSENKNNPK